MSEGEKTVGPGANELTVEDFGRQFTTSGVLNTMKRTIVPPGSQVVFVGSFTDPTDKELLRKTKEHGIGGGIDEGFGVWNVYQVDVGEGVKERIHTQPGSKADLKARGIWQPPQSK